MINCTPSHTVYSKSILISSHLPEEDKARGACWETQHHIRKRGQTFATNRRQAKSQRGSKLGRLDGARQQAPSTWRWVRASSRELISHGRTICFRQLTTGPSGKGKRKRLYWPGPSPRLSQVGPSGPQLRIRTHPNPVSQWRQPIGECLATCLGL
jgi:hypothetical protein